MSYFVLAESTFIERDLFKENYRMVQVEHNSLSLKKNRLFLVQLFLIPSCVICCIIVLVP